MTCLVRTRNGVTESYTYDGADKLTQITGGANPRTFTYDLAGRTTQISSGAGTTTTLDYDYDGRVTSITYPNATSDAFAYNGSGARVSSSGVNGSKTFRRNGVGVTSPLLDDGTTQYTPGVSSRTGSTSKFQHSGLKNATDQTDSAQSVTASRHYDAFGNLISSSGSWQGIHGYAGSFGYQEDGNGLKLLGHRYYDSDTGRFLSQDPIKDGRNWYSYCDNKPNTSVDPHGLSPVRKVVTWLYRLIRKDTKEFLKNGITNTPDTRYTKKKLSEMNAEMDAYAKYEEYTDRKHAPSALVDENYLNRKYPGKENHERWAGADASEDWLDKMKNGLLGIVGLFDPMEDINDTVSLAGETIMPLVHEGQAMRQRTLENLVDPDTVFLE